MELFPFASLAEMSKGLAARKYTSVELLQAYLDRIAQLDSRAGAYISVLSESALLQAQAADLQRHSGFPLPPLHGLPIAIKDMFEIEGHVTTAGSAAWRERRSTRTSTVAQRLLAQGMIILGKLHMSEFAFSGWGANQFMGTPRNPWDWEGEHRVPGGSSSGSGVAVAAGLAPAAIGSDTGGSVRIPAALNGVTGIKPTSGRVGMYGVIPLAASFDCIGPLTRTAEDAGLLLQALSGCDLRDPNTSADGIGPWQEEDVSVMKSLRIGIVHPGQYPWPVDDEVQRATDEAAWVFRSLGARMEEVELPLEFPEIFEDWHIMTATEAYRYHAGYIENSDLNFDPWVKKRVLAGRSIQASDYVSAQLRRRDVTGRLLAWMRNYDLLLSPTVPSPACLVTEVQEEVTPLGTLTRWVNYIDGCAISLPAGFSSQGMPIGVQLVAAPWDEGRLLQAGRAFQCETDWHLQTPPGLK